MNRAAKSLFLLLLIVILGPSPNRADAKSDRAEMLRSDFAAKKMIVGQASDLGSARAIATMAQYFYGTFEKSFKKCGIQGIADTPARIERNMINTFAVNFRGRGTNACSGIRDRAACEYLQDNCITLGNTIFCDYDYLLLLRQLARASFAYAHLNWAANPKATIETVRFLPFSPDLLVDFANYQLSPKSIDLKDSATALPGSVRGAIGHASKYPSMIQESAEFAVLGAVIGHEMAHIESNSCPLNPEYTELEKSIQKRVEGLGIKIYNRHEAREIATKYKSMTCHGTLSQAELAADLRGIEMIGTTLYLQNALHILGYGEKKTDKATEQLWRLDTAAAVIALAQMLEYQLIVLGSPESAISEVRGEPKSMENSEMYKYYTNLAIRRTEKSIQTDHALTGQRHMHPSFRAGLLLQAAGMRGLYEKRRKFGFGISFPIRLYAYINGSLYAQNVLECANDPNAAGQLAFDFLTEISGITEGEYLVD